MIYMEYTGTHEHTRTCTHIHTHAYSCTHMYTETQKCTHIHTYTYTCMVMYTYVHADKMHIYTCVHMYTHAHKDTHMYTHVHKDIYAHTYTHAGTYTHVHTHEHFLPLSITTLRIKKIAKTSFNTRYVTIPPRIPPSKGLMLYYEQNYHCTDLPDPSCSLKTHKQTHAFFFFFTESCNSRSSL